MEITRWEDRPDGLRDPALVVSFRGWNDAAAAASSALAVVGAELDAHRVAVIDPEEFYDFQSTRPMIDLSESGTRSITWPDVELYVARPEAGPRDLLLLAGAEPSMRWRTFCSLVLDIAQELGARMIVTMGALLADVAHTRSVRLTTMASDEALVAGLGGRPPSYQGPTGIVGVLHHEAASRGLNAVSLWAPVPHYASGVANPKAALALLVALQAVTGVAIDTSELQEATTRHERDITRAVQSDSRLQALVERLEQAADSAPSFHAGDLPSGDELAQELERFLRERESGTD